MKAIVKGVATLPVALRPRRAPHRLGANRIIRNVTAPKFEAGDFS
jgi:hypothetical protein